MHVSREHGTLRRVRHLALRNPIANLLDARRTRRPFAIHARLLCTRSGNLRLDGLVVALSLVELLRSRRFLLEQPALSLERAAPDVELRRKHTNLARRRHRARLGGLALRECLRSFER